MLIIEFVEKFSMKIELASLNPLKFFSGEKVFSQYEINHIARHSYVAGGYTPLDRFMYAFVYDKLIHFIPMWMAPNVITISGLVALLVATGVSLSYAPTFTEICPPAVYIGMVFAMFFYLVMDALDGRQARRTGSSSPLGQLFDHGSDSIATACMCIMMLICLRTGATYLGAVLLIVPQLAFFLAQQEEHFTGVLSTSMGWIGVTESSFFMMSLPAVTFLVSPAVWDRLVPGFQVLTYRYAVALALIKVCALAIVWSIIRVIKSYKGYPIAGIIQWQSLVLVMLAARWLMSAPAMLMGLAVSIAFTYTSIAMIISNVSGKRFPIFFWNQLPLLIVATMNHLGMCCGLEKAMEVVCWIEGVALLRLVVRTTAAISNGLNIHVFRIKPKAA